MCPYLIKTAHRISICRYILTFLTIQEKLVNISPNFTTASALLIPDGVNRLEEAASLKKNKKQKTIGVILFLEA